MRVLITNDDGIHSPGIRALAGVAANAGLDVVVAAPCRDSSGASASLKAVEQDGRLMIEDVPWNDIDVRQVMAMDAAPAFIVRAAVTGAFGPAPDVVLSGINHGPNTGHAVLHSGTVGAALTASTHGRRALAVSIGMGTPTHWETAARVAGAVLEWLLDAEPMVLNVNVPNVAIEELRGLRQARLAAFGAVQATVADSGKGYVKLAYADVGAEAEDGTDAAAVAAGFACFTPLEAVCEAVDVALGGLQSRLG